MKPTRCDAYAFFQQATQVLARIEENGIRVDTEYLDRTMAETDAKIKDADRRLKESKEWKMMKRRFKEPNLSSDPQLRWLFFDALGYKPKAYTAKSEDKDVKLAAMDEYSLRHIDIPFKHDLFKVKKLRKVHGTYLKGILREVYDGILRPSYNLAGGLEDEQTGGAASYRGSSSNPNFQNIPIRNKEMAELIRQAFIARSKKRRIVERDFSGIEVKVAYMYHKDRTMRKYLTGGGDMHGDQAAFIYFLTEQHVRENADYYKKSIRDSAKNQWVFPQFYGSVWFQCAPNMWEAMEQRKFKIKTSKGEIDAREHLRRNGITELGPCEPKSEPREGTFARHLQNAEKKLWYERFPQYTEWKKRFYRQYEENGYFDLYTGFRCEGFFRRNQVINFPVQGAAFHCLLWVLIEVQKEIDRLGKKTLLIGQIHDSMLADVPEDELQWYLDLTEHLIKVALMKAWDWIIIPMESEVEVCPLGGNWFQKKDWCRNKNGIWELAA